MNDSYALLASGIYGSINTPTEPIYYSDQNHDPLERGSGQSVVVTFRTPVLTFNKLAMMSQKRKLKQFPFGKTGNEILDVFYKKYWGSATEINERLKLYINNVFYYYHTFIFTGHDGGAVLVTYRAPRIGNASFAVFLSRENLKVMRVTIGNDHVPLFFGHKYLIHSFGEIWIPGNDGCECFNSKATSVPDCNLQFERPPDQLPEKATAAHFGLYFGYLMSPQGCRV
ncbi:hypothetical protein G9A89_001234 [Geosiphon pyriformis]|nr:hypothetical protein G9A89_001234 [Geosiphon pyriformis]